MLLIVPQLLIEHFQKRRFVVQEVRSYVQLQA